MIFLLVVTRSWGWSWLGRNGRHATCEKRRAIGRAAGATEERTVEYKSALTGAAANRCPARSWYGSTKAIAATADRDAMTGTQASAAAIVVIPDAKAWARGRDDNWPCNGCGRCNDDRGARSTVAMSATAHDRHVTRAHCSRCCKARRANSCNGVTAEAMTTTEVMAAIIAAMCKTISAAKSTAGMREAATKSMSAMTEAATTKGMPTTEAASTAEDMTAAEAASAAEGMTAAETASAAEGMTAAETASTSKGMAAAEATSATKGVSAATKAATESTAAKSAATTQTAAAAAVTTTARFRRIRTDEARADAHRDAPKRGCCRR